MYSLVSAVAKSFSSQGRWEALDVSQLSFQSLYSDYLKVVTTLTNPFIDHPVSLDLADIRTQVGDTSQTFSAFLSANADNSLPTSDTLLTLSTAYARYNDAFRAGYKVQPVGPTQAPDAQLPKADKTWLYLSKTGVDFSQFYEHCLVVVNGFVHRTVQDGTQGAWVVDGMKSVLRSNCNQIGLINFQRVAGLSFLPVTPSMIYKQLDTQRYRDRMYINLGQDVSNKTVMLSLGGYLHVLDPQTFYRVGDTQVAIDFANLPLFDRYYESFDYLDYSSLPIDRTDRNVTQINVDNFLSDENLLAYMQLSQTFFIILDNVDVFRDLDYVPNAKVPGYLIAYEEPLYPLMNGVGKLANYWPRYEDHQWALACVDNFWQQRNFHTFSVYEAQGITSQRVTTDTTRLSRAFFLKIGTDLAQAA